MKKSLIFLVLFAVIGYSIFTSRVEVVAQSELRGVFISYIEEERYFSGGESIAKENIDQMIKNLVNNHFNFIVLQVRSVQDAIYKSDIFPFSSYITGQESEEYFDILEYFTRKCHENNMLLYAWINPYRIRTMEDTSSITPLSPAYPYLNTDTIYIGNGVFFNPSKQNVEDLIVKGVEEVAKNYDVDGILFDDYFYPSTDVDIADYYAYLENHSYLTIQDYHLMIINQMIERVHKICNLYGKVFGVSPDGNIENNYSYIYADIYTWLSSDKYVDFIMPQIYYGFFHETMPYYTAINMWSDAIKNSNIELIIALALYKSGNMDLYAKSGREEWIRSSNILVREVMLARNLRHYKGFVLFRYDNLFTDDVVNENSVQEANNLQKILK